MAMSFNNGKIGGLVGRMIKQVQTKKKTGAKTSSLNKVKAKPVSKAKTGGALNRTATKVTQKAKPVSKAKTGGTLNRVATKVAQKATVQNKSNYSKKTCF